MTTQEITERLGRNPTEAFESGRRMSQRNPHSRVREETLWLLESPLPDGSTLEAQLEWAGETVAAMREELASLPPGSVDLFIGWALPSAQTGFTLRRELLAKLEGVPLDIDFDLYAVRLDAEGDEEV